MEPLREAQKATKFRRYMDGGRQMHVAVDDNTMGHDIIPADLYDLPDNSLALTDIKKHHFIVSLKRTKATVCLDDLKEFEEWTKEFGEEGR